MESGPFKGPVFLRTWSIYLLKFYIEELYNFLSIYSTNFVYNKRDYTVDKDGNRRLLRTYFLLNS